MMCPEGETLDPRTACTCITEEESEAIYPADASERDIDYSFDLMYEELDKHPYTWPECDPMPRCAPGTYFNELSCGCWALPDEIYCDIVCMEFSDPRGGCGNCISEREFLLFFPCFGAEN